MTTKNLKDWIVLAKILRFMSAIFATLAVSFVMGMTLGQVMIICSLADIPQLRFNNANGPIIYTSLTVLCGAGSILFCLQLSKRICGRSTHLFGCWRRQRTLPSDAITDLYAQVNVKTCAMALPVMTVIASLIVGSIAVAGNLEPFRWLCEITDLLVLVAIVVGVVTAIYLRVTKRCFARLSRSEGQLDYPVILFQPYE